MQLMTTAGAETLSRTGAPALDRRVMLVEGDDSAREYCSELLNGEGFDVEAFADHRPALARAAEVLPGLVLLEVSLNRERDAGFQLCAELRRLSRTLPIVFFAERDSEHDRISGLRLGADDYLNKNVAADYLVIRIEALLRRYAELSAAAGAVTDKSDDAALVCGPLLIDLDKLVVRWDGRGVELNPTQIRIAHELAASPGSVKSFSRLMRAAGVCVEPNTITAHIRTVRNAFRTVFPDFDRIRSERGVGYRWLAE